jgi:hypothetical protein
LPSSGGCGEQVSLSAGRANKKALKSTAINPIVKIVINLILFIFPSKIMVFYFGKY